MMMMMQRCVSNVFDSIRSLRLRHMFSQAITLGMFAAMGIIFWKGLILATGCEAPLVVVLSESMEPGFKRGDILFLHMNNDPIGSGDIIVFKVEGRPIPIVHRVIKAHKRRDSGMTELLTKGDNNEIDDRLLYASGQQWVHPQYVIGKAVGFLPYLGWMSIIMTDMPIAKYVFFGTLGLLAITSKE